MPLSNAADDADAQNNTKELLEVSSFSKIVGLQSLNTWLVVKVTAAWCVKTLT